MIALVAVFCGSFAFAAEELTKFDPDQLRATLTQFKDHPPAQRLEIKGPVTGPKQLWFLQYYQETVFPKFQEMQAMIFKYRALSVFVDARMSRNEAEHDAYEAEFKEVREEANRWSVDPEWTEILRVWAARAEGLEGQLPNLARRLNKERQLEAFPENLKPVLDEVSKLQQDYMQAINEVPAAAGMATFGGELMTIRRKFKAGEITFHEAHEQTLKLLSTKGPHIVAQQAVERAGEGLNRMAVLRSQLAKAKGVATWAQYATELNGQGYSPDYRGPQNQRAFLRRYIEALKPLRAAFFERRIKELGLEGERANLRYSHMGLLTLPGLQQLQPYFPKEKVRQIWEETLLESGFTPEMLKQITADLAPREGKNPTAAYLNGFTGPYTDTEVVDGQTLNEIQPPKSAYKPGFVYILQNFAGAGLSDLKTLFHEGGHALEKILKFKTEPTGEAYGYVEVPSMTSERFGRDLEILFNKAVPVDGHKPTREEISTLIANDQQNDIVNLLAMASGALFDLELWDYDYSAPGAMTYLERVKSVDEDLRQLAGDFPYLETPAPYYLANISTPHYVSGEVRDIGYTYAEIASRMMARYLCDEIEKISGRRSWYQQPELARLFAEKFFQVGWKSQFPGNIEKITGRRFSAEDVVKEMAGELGHNVCERKLM